MGAPASPPPASTTLSPRVVIPPAPLPPPTIFPPPLRRGDTVAVSATSSPFAPVLGWRGLGFLAERYRLRYDRKALFARRGYLAGEDAARRDALAAALEDPDVAAILVARGGYGANRF